MGSIAVRVLSAIKVCSAHFSFFSFRLRAFDRDVPEVGRENDWKERRRTSDLGGYGYGYPSYYGNSYSSYYPSYYGYGNNYGYGNYGYGYGNNYYGYGNNNYYNYNNNGYNYCNYYRYYNYQYYSYYCNANNGYYGK